MFVHICVLSTVRQAKLLGGIFSINLAGLQTTILSSKQTMKQVYLEKMTACHALHK